ncbi:hypothetical protein [Cupriavidus sp. H18C1]|uniref:hypothetical protein n=1 Tax=Cupriavidus sp. H18C1 TaxID=3241601 RepID=UPI003BB98C99
MLDIKFRSEYLNGSGSVVAFGSFYPLVAWINLRQSRQPAPEFIKVYTRGGYPYLSRGVPPSAERFRPVLVRIRDVQNSVLQCMAELVLSPQTAVMDRFVYLSCAEAERFQTLSLFPQFGAEVLTSFCSACHQFKEALQFDFPCSRMPPVVVD